MTRRQNRSCDQCRRAKRACDAPALADLDPGASGMVSLDLLDGSSLKSLVGTCSYCAKTGKRCTFHWLIAQVKGNSRHGPSDRPAGKRRRVQTSPKEPKTLPNAGSGSGSSTASFQLPYMPHPSPPDSEVWSYIPCFDSTGSPGLYGPHASTSVDGGAYGVGYGSGGDQLSASDDSTTLLGCEDWNQLLDDPLGIRSPFGPSDGLLQLSTGLNDPPGFPHEAWDSPTQSGILALQQPLTRRPQSTQARRWPSVSDQSPALSPFSLDFQMAERLNGSIVYSNLMRIYHDVMEGALSCWLTEHTCPYKMKPKAIKWQMDNDSSDNGGQYSSAPRYSESMKQEWGPAWSNRIYRRVMKLDQVAQSSRVTRLTKSQDQAATRAFHLVIMAFASQWAHGSQRSREKYTSPFDFNVDAEPATEFDRTVQLSLWTQARTALQDCAELESFRIATAELIFGLTQRPEIDDEEVLATPTSIIDDDVSLRAKINEVLELEGPPMFMERASRKILALKFRFENEDMRANGHHRSNSNVNGREGAPEGLKLDLEDRRTIGLLYWLSLMFDTVSSAMNSRPVVVADSECVKEPDEEPDGESDKASPEDQHLQRQNSQIIWRGHFTKSFGSQQLRWPCSYETAAEGMANAAPIKVLLFRHVTYAQTNLVRRPRPEVVEESIQNAFSVYRYWNNTFGLFIQDCIDQYETVPQRIRSWFVCVVGHWHCAALMLADMIEAVDEQELGVPACRQNRINANTVQTLRRDNSIGLSDMSRVTTPSASRPGSDVQLEDSHSAVSEGPLLTEPWTIILIRAFARAGLYHLEEAKRLRGVPPPQNGYSSTGLGMKQHQSPLLESSRRCEDCIRALWHLGRKSDMARRLAQLLGDALARVTKGNNGMTLRVVDFTANWENISGFENGSGLNMGTESTFWW